MFFYFLLSIVLVPLLLIATGVVDTVWLPLSARNARLALAALLAPVVVSAALPIKRKVQPAWTVRLGRWIMRAGQEYLGLQTVYVDQAAVKQDARAIFLLEPHGVLPMSICGFVAGGLKTHPFSVRGAVTGACFKVPMMRHVYTWCGADSVDKKDIETNLKDGMSIVLCPGGVQEAALVGTQPDTIRLYIRSRKGMVRLAMRHGVPIVPCFAFGTENAFSIVGGAHHSPAWLKTIGRLIGFMPMCFLGVCGLPMAPPPPGNYTNVIGRPIDCGSGADVVEEAAVERILSEIIEQYEQLYATYNAQYGAPNFKLSIE
jgi:2-acylglycerol O-acyltransferase 2